MGRKDSSKIRAVSVSGEGCVRPLRMRIGSKVPHQDVVAVAADTEASGEVLDVVSEEARADVLDIKGPLSGLVY